MLMVLVILLMLSITVPVVFFSMIQMIPLFKNLLLFIWHKTNFSCCRFLVLPVSFSKSEKEKKTAMGRRQEERSKILAEDTLRLIDLIGLQKQLKKR